MFMQIGYVFARAKREWNVNRDLYFGLILCFAVLTSWLFSILHFSFDRDSKAKDFTFISWLLKSRSLRYEGSREEECNKVDGNLSLFYSEQFFWKISIVKVVKLNEIYTISSRYFRMYQFSTSKYPRAISLAMCNYGIH